MRYALEECESGISVGEDGDEPEIRRRYDTARWGQ